MNGLPGHLPEQGLGEAQVLEQLTAAIEQESADLGSSTAFAHMDPPTPEIAAAIAGLSAAQNQNLLHPDLSPLATRAERCVIGWLAPLYSMANGHMCAGSSIANLTALWCAREHGAKQVVASADAHLSVAKAAHILGMDFVSVAVDEAGSLDPAHLPDCSNSALVLTAGTTGRGAIDPLSLTGAKWLHVDAAWAGPLQLTRHAELLSGIGTADSVAISAHKWFYQPKDSALVLFRDSAAQESISFGGAYLAVPNVGVQGSRGAAGLTLLATLLAFGREGLAARIEKSMADAVALAQWLEAHPRCRLKQMPHTGVINWQPRDRPVDTVAQALRGISSTTRINGETWMRQVAANPHVSVETVAARIDALV